MPETNGLNLSQIKSDALASTSGPWKIREGEAADWGEIVGALSEKLVARVIARASWDADFIDQCRKDGTDPTYETARHIANMDPPTTIALVEEVERLRSENERLRANVNGVSWTKDAMLISENDPQEYRKYAAFARFRKEKGDGFITHRVEFVEAVGDHLAEVDGEPPLDEIAYRQALGEDNER